MQKIEQLQKWNGKMQHRDSRMRTYCSKRVFELLAQSFPKSGIIEELLRELEKGNQFQEVVPLDFVGRKFFLVHEQRRIRQVHQQPESKRKSWNNNHDEMARENRFWTREIEERKIQKNAPGHQIENFFILGMVNNQRNQVRLYYSRPQDVPAKISVVVIPAKTANDIADGFCTRKTKKKKNILVFDCSCW